jgi:hypothetical protein
MKMSDNNDRCVYRNPETGNIVPYCDLEHPNAGASVMATEAAKRIMNLDGLAMVRMQCSPEYDVNAFAATWARIIDEEFRQLLHDSAKITAALATIVTPTQASEILRYLKSE